MWGFLWYGFDRSVSLRFYRASLFGFWASENRPRCQGGATLPVSFFSRSHLEDIKTDNPCDPTNQQTHNTHSHVKPTTFDKHINHINIYHQEGFGSWMLGAEGRVVISACMISRHALGSSNLGIYSCRSNIFIILLFMHAHWRNPL